VRLGFRLDKSSNVTATALAGASATVVHDAVMTPFDGKLLM
jgi:hypothetical protein